MAQENFIKNTLETIKRRPQRSYKKKSGCGLKRKPTPYPLRHYAGDSSMSLPEDQPAQPMPKPKGEGPRAYGLTRTPTPVPTRGAKKERRVSVAPGIQKAAEESEVVEVLGAHLEKLNLSSRVQGALVTIVVQGFEVERDLTQTPPAKEGCSEAPRHVSTLELLPSKLKREGQSHFGGLKWRPTPFPSKQGLGLLDNTETAASACFIDKHRYAWYVDAVKVNFLLDALRKHVDSQLQSTERLRLPKPGPSPLCQAYVLPEPEVDYEPDIPSKVGYIRPLSAGDKRGHDIGSGLRRVPTPIPGVGGI